MVDSKTHRPLRIPPDFIQIEIRSDSVFGQSPGKIPVPANPQVCETRTVKYADLDVVGHVNNVKYIEWCVNAVDADLVMKRGISDFSINFISEARLDEQVEIRCSFMANKGESDQSGAMVGSGKNSPWNAEPLTVPQKMYISGHNLNTGRECFQAVITFHPALCAQ